ncbi:hypothetical protein DIQ79_03500 [Mycolicibacterium smegmatis]|uniref:Uncharacterized protein n=1 Tax=Mycolicibacterium smegmatis (strain ATCC 700084 / mc(2)155) TaxID=246196 RepID=A0QWS7_MYCS2|nr:hypothetical protein MSMEG_3049 [Mycolicibacterium smegmatis MC2 155]TBM52792.1 hypothetical protein DIQ86_02080 [Mycolicibacterium smegmatis]TBH51660.1 hypothetical protein EYS45_02175 [Mycolicibacterium smegmatis MC2 155]TBM55485.1 hypothetical protein DIQ85_03495 [Mycolicibacterium smegmatis]TBM66555.1 hypothetical protein DIQ83_03500 [Mycolicibacterium smegmatis]
MAPAEENFRWSRRVGRVEALTGGSNDAVETFHDAAIHATQMHEPPEQPSPVAYSTHAPTTGRRCTSRP